MRRCVLLAAILAGCSATSTPNARNGSVGGGGSDAQANSSGASDAGGYESGGNSLGDPTSTGPGGSDGSSGSTDGGGSYAATGDGATDAMAETGATTTSLDSGTGRPTDVDVYLIGGQSNATGQGYSNNIPSTFAIDTRVELYHSAGIVSGGGANTWIALRAASEGTDGCNLGLRFGPELGFGTNIQFFYPNRHIYIIKHATSNTGLATDWAPGSSASDRAHFGPQFATFVSTVDGGIQALKTNGLNPIIRGMLWQQGERDVDIGGTAASNYGNNLSAFIARVREQWNGPNILFVYGYIYPASNFGTARDEVRQAEANVDQDSGNPLSVKGAFVVIDDTLSLRASDPHTCLPNDKIHFGTQGQLDLGRLMATKVHDKLQLP